MLENYRAGVRVSAAPATLQLLAVLDAWHDPAALAAKLPGYSRSSVARAVETLVRVPLVAMSTMLGLSCAIQHWIDLPGLGRLPLKTYPSGGARHPLEVYLLAPKVAGLAPGIYHYAADSHELELVRLGATGRQIVSYLPTQPWYRSAAALLIITAVFPRTQWKYRFPRAYRAVVTEAGHLGQTLCLAATWLGLAPFCSLALADSLIERDLGIDGVSESVLYVVGVGTRPGRGRRQA
jgi:SagB-type dehydrogenase family enzyme